MESSIYNQKGEEVGKISLPESIFALPWNADLVHRAFVSYTVNDRMSIAHTKNRAEVAGGGRKPWRQKGTGRARHGSIRSPLWVGGGITFGPRSERVYEAKINKKEKTKALYVALSEKMRRGQIFFVDTLSFSEPKTREAKNLLTTLGTALGNDMGGTRTHGALFLTEKHEAALARSFRNIGNAEIKNISDVNLPDVLRSKYLVVVDPNKSLSILEGRKLHRRANA
ncbi:MAG: 50S ribosomal protein L4 [Parcubacteria group bacterium]|nr:50S ribosomal protein L4 [Parcubacteria group bacterium]